MSGGVTFGVIGHVDHGKTALVRALTGIETDRLKEERERGLSIVLGFAFLETEHGAVDLIDVPGHEDFIRAMIGGATALDGVVLCVAANEGIKPQTVEHFNIARLLGVERGVIVITKADLADEEKLASVRSEIEHLVRGTFLERAPVLDVSASSGAGIDALREALNCIAATPVQRETHGRFFLPLDRAFTLRGFGLVVTGTLRGGELRVGDAVEIMPAGKAATVRALQNHNHPVESAVPGQRVAVNLRHLGREDVARGDVLAAPGTVVPARRLDVEIRLLDSAEHAVANGAAVRVLTGTTDVVARVRLLDRSELAPGETAVAQLNLDREVATRVSERFLLRSYSPMHTVGGGRILDVNTHRHRRFDESVKLRLETAASGDIERIVAQRLEEAGVAGVRLAGLAETPGVERDELLDVVAHLGARRVGEDLAVAERSYETLLLEVLAALQRFHVEHPLKRGLDAASLTNALASKPHPEVTQQAVAELVGQKKVQRAHELLSIAGYDPFARLGERERKLLDDIERAFLAGRLEPPRPEAVVGSSKAAQVIYGLLLETGRLVRLKTYDRNADVVLHADTLDDARRAVARAFPYPQPFAVKQARDLLGSTRKYIVPLLEHFDATGVTARSGDLRRLRGEEGRDSSG